ncbi:uncharacterized protein LOC119840695 [Zerene cesonia]|uniref:uncharacterized protein LOC119840695 n=1 Tax=Zerene cesonia TaxID=33412 RepID=UPI0018E5965D|nr:uncharacterized protein LOC119840695 [Zerene cesonia]
MSQALDDAAREVILKIKRFCEAEKNNKSLLIPITNVRARVAAMTGVSEKTVSRITKEGNIATRTCSKIVTPGKCRPHPKKYNLHDYHVRLIRQKIQQFYTANKKLPTVNKLRIELLEDIEFKGSNTTLRRILKEKGFRLNPCKSKRKTLDERLDTVSDPTNNESDSHCSISDVAPSSDHN